MRGPDGGSRHDPAAARPDQMWMRGPVRTDLICHGCEHGTDPAARRHLKHRVLAGSLLVLVCSRCDGGTRNGVV